MTLGSTSLLEVVRESPLNLEIGQLTVENTGTEIGNIAEVISRKIEDPEELRQFGGLIRFILTGKDIRVTSNREYYGGPLHGLCREIRNPTEDAAKDLNRPQIIATLVDDDNPAHSLALAKNSLKELVSQSLIEIHYFSENEDLRRDLGKLDSDPEKPINVTVKVFDRTKFSSLSTLYEKGISKEEFEKNQFRFIAPQSMKKQLDAFLDYENIKGIDFESNKNKDRFRVYLMLTETFNPLTIEIERRQLRDLDKLGHWINTILAQA